MQVQTAFSPKTSILFIKLIPFLLGSLEGRNTESNLEGSANSKQCRILPNVIQITNSQYMISQKPHVLENVKCHLCKGLKTSIIPIHLVVSNNGGSDNANSIEVKTSPPHAEENQEECCGTVEVQIGRASCAELVTEKSPQVAEAAKVHHGTAISETCEESQTVFNNASSQTDEKLW